MSFFCVKCNTEASLPLSGKPSRTESCTKCGADLHACIQCKHYDPSAYNSCREPQAERVVEKERSNFCDYFSFIEGSSANRADTNSKDDAMKKLDDLFK